MNGSVLKRSLLALSTHLLNPHILHRKTNVSNIIIPLDVKLY